MNKSILKIYIPSTAKSLPVYLNDDSSAWWYSGSSLMVNLRAVITDYPHMVTDLSDIAPTAGNSLIPNPGFSTPQTGGIIPSYWSGNWYDWNISGSAITPTYPVGFSWNYYPRTGQRIWDTAYSNSYLSPYNLTETSYHYIVSGSFNIISGSEYSTSIKFLSDNGYWNINPSTALPDKETSYTIDILGAKTIIDAGENSYQYSPGNRDVFPLEADYGAIIYYTNGSSVFTELIASGRGRTTNEINQYDTNTGIPYATPIWKTYKSSFVPKGTGNSVARLYIYNRYVKRPSNQSIGWQRPWVYVDWTVITPSKPYITQNIGSSSEPIDMDSYSTFEVDSPLVETEISELNFYATSLTSTGCALTTTSGSTTTTTYGFHEPGVPAGNDSYTLSFGKDDNEVIWASWMPFPGSVFNTLTEGVHITSASLTFIATEDIITTPSKTCYITTGLEETAYDTSPVIPTSYVGIKDKSIKNQLNTTLLNSWTTGGEYNIDITDSVKEQLGKKAIRWGSASIAAIVKNNNSAIGGYRQVASGSHLAYSPPKLTIGYVKNGYPKNSLVLNIRKSDPMMNYYTSPSLYIGGNDPTRARALAYFNLSSLPSGAITEANLILHQLANPGTGTQTIQVFAVTGDKKWDYYGTSWIKRFGAGSASNWLTAGGDFSALCASLSGIPVWGESYGIWRYIPFNQDGINILNNMKNNPLTNNGFIIKDSSETNTSFFKYCSSNHPYQNSAGQRTRPILRVKINNINYDIQYMGPSEDVTGDGGTPPTPPPAPSAIILENSQFIETGENNNIANYSLRGAENTNRYILIAEGWSDNNSQWGYDAHFNNLYFGTYQMTPIIVDRSDEANLIFWGLSIPNTMSPNINNVITGEKQVALPGGRRSIKLFVREFSHVNQGSPIYNSSFTHQGANSAIQCYDTSATYVTRGMVVDAAFLANPSTNLGVPQKMYNIQTRDHSELRYGFSHFTPGSTGGTATFNWSWNRDNGAPYASSGSDNVLGVVSLRPE